MDEQGVLTMLTVVHRDPDPPNRWGDWFERGEGRLLCATCRGRWTRGRYCEDPDGVLSSEPMCPSCWVRLTAIGVEVEQADRSETTPRLGGVA